MQHRPRLIVAAALALPALLANPAAEAQSQVRPEQSPFPQPRVVSPSWNLDFEHQKPEAIAIQGLDGRYQWFWYLPYKVINHTGDEQLFIPEVTIYTDRGDIVNAGDRVPAVVYAAIRQQLGNDLLESPVEVVGRILQGADYARESVAIWPAFDHDVDHMTIFVGGLSGETQRLADPLTGEEILLRRTLQLDYKTPGNYPTPQYQPVIPAGEREVMR